MSQKLAIGQPV